MVSAAAARHDLESLVAPLTTALTTEEPQSETEESLRAMFLLVALSFAAIEGGLAEPEEVAKEKDSS